MDETHIYLLSYFANLAFIVTNIYGWIIKEFHTARPYKKHFKTLFPAQRLVGLLYLIQLLEIPYLLMIGQPAALFYINAFSVLFFSSMEVVIAEGYFFQRQYTIKQLVIYFLPVCVTVGWLLLAALDVVPVTLHFYQWMFWIVCLLFLFYITKVVMVQKKILRKVNDIIKGDCSTDKDFPILLSLRTKWLLLPIPLLMFGCFLCNDVYIKMVRDVLFTIVNVWFLIYTIKPHRKIIQEETPSFIEPKDNSKYKLSPERCLELEQQITDKLKNEKIFLNPTLTIDILAEQLDSNKSYVSEAINRSQFGSYYAMINNYRIEHAIAMLKEDPKQKIEYVSMASGFSSSSVFSQVFKRHMGMSAKEYVSSFNTTR